MINPSYSPLPEGEGSEVRARARVFRKLRVSLTRSCNFGCVYCAYDGKAVVDPRRTAADQFVAWIGKIQQHTLIGKIRLTGGEPTLYPQLVELAQALSAITSAELSMTTNGHRLQTLAAPLREAGLTAVNISLDAMDEAVFRSMGGRAFRQVLAGITEARRAGLHVRINATLVREMNDSQILPLLRFARAEGVVIRFLELMQMGHLQRSRRSQLVAADDILAEVRREYAFVPLGRSQSETANYYEMPDGYRFGIVGNSSMPFCNDCDRLRLDSQGRVYGCLSNAQGFSLESGDAKDILEQAMALKQPQKFTGSELVMREVGG